MLINIEIYGSQIVIGRKYPVGSTPVIKYYVSQCFKTNLQYSNINACFVCLVIEARKKSMLRQQNTLHTGFFITRHRQYEAHAVT